MRLSEQAQAIIRRTEYATIATVDEQGQPWNAPVYFGYDTDYNLYFGSYKDSQHAKNIRGKGDAFIVIYNSTVLPGRGEGVYIRAKCNELSDPNEIITVHKCIQARRDPIPYWKVEQLQGDTPIRLYKAVLQKVWANDGDRVDGIYIDTRKDASR